MAKAITNEEIDATIHTQIARNLKVIARLKRAEEEGDDDRIGKAVKLLEQANRELQGMLK